MIKKRHLKNKGLCKVTFSLPLEAVQQGQEIRVVGDFNDWNWENGLRMKAAKTAYQATVDLEAGKKYEFRYQMGDGQWANDPEADGYTPSPYKGVHNCVVLTEAPDLASSGESNGA